MAFSERSERVVNKPVTFLQLIKWLKSHWSQVHDQILFYDTINNKRPCPLAVRAVCHRVKVIRPESREPAKVVGRLFSFAFEPGKAEEAGSQKEQGGRFRDGCGFNDDIVQ
ncbi:hypothetical protein JCM14469_38680 [Desulfatiferula olefinivorans]